jgi:hypothetical protein
LLWFQWVLQILLCHHGESQVSLSQVSGFRAINTYSSQTTQFLIIWSLDIASEDLLGSEKEVNLSPQWKINQISWFRFSSSWKKCKVLLLCLGNSHSLLGLRVPRVQGTSGE